MVDDMHRTIDNSRNELADEKMMLNNHNLSVTSTDPSIVHPICFSCAEELLQILLIPNGCLHKFCRSCVQNLKVKKCPVCKKIFKYLIEWEVPSNDDQFNDVIKLVSGPCLTDLLKKVSEEHLHNWWLVAAEFRKKIYSKNLRVEKLNFLPYRWREFTPEFFRNNQPEVHRLRPWLVREVIVLLDLCDESNVNCDDIVTEILGLLHDYSIQSSKFKEYIQRYFVAHTETFIHEFFQFASSVYDLHGFDNIAYYIDFDVQKWETVEMNMYLDIQQLFKFLIKKKEKSQMKLVISKLRGRINKEGENYVTSH